MITLLLIAIVSVVDSATEVTLKQTAPYLQQLQLVQNSEDVIPPKADVHRVTATYNREAIIPPQCYTRTEGRHNPCYVCHQDAVRGRENNMNDADLQEAYSFSDVGLTNHWKNLFEDRSRQVARISDTEILEWVSQDNYSELAGRLRAAGFKGWIPDLRGLQEGAGAFDGEGFARDGSYWVAFNYKPFPSTFWPTNGSTDDVMIRLPEIYRIGKSGEFSPDIYKANLSIVEANLKGMAEISTWPIDERAVGIDLNGDNELGVVTRITRVSRLVGAAEEYFFEPSIYPIGTEFLHTVRYLGIEPNGDITVPRRMKEVRYMQKVKMSPKFELENLYRMEGYEKEAGNLPGYFYRGDKGLYSGMGWAIQGFIEDRNGRLRANTYEETLFCMGCHNSIGATIDKTFSFARKVDGAQGWGYINLKGMPDAPNLGETKGEIATYFERVGGGDEFRSNPEMQRRWFNEDGSVAVNKVAKAADVYELITPSRDRALALNKAYKIIVEDQDFIYGRDATVLPPENVYERVDNETSPTLPPERIYSWNIQLDWSMGTTDKPTVKAK